MKILEEYLLAIEETLHLVSIPGMAASIREGLQTPLEETIDKLGW